MSQYSNMALTPSPSPSPSPLDFSDENKKLDIDTTKSLVTIINQHMHAILENTESQKALKLKCTSKLKIQSQEFFEFSEHSVLSNLYWGIENAESASRAKNVDEKITRLRNSEKMLQIPASLDENGVTMGISNSYLICCSYFYLSVVEFLRKNEWQMAMHFLQAVLISPRIVYTEFAPGIWQRLFPLFIRHRIEEIKSFGSRRKNSVSASLISDFDDGMVDDVMICMARRYKPWLMYYQIMSSGDFQNRGDGICLADDQSECNMNWQAPSYNTNPERTASHQLQTQVDETKVIECFSRSFPTSYCDTNKSASSITKINHYTPTLDDYIDEEEKLHMHHYVNSISLKNHQLHHKSFSRMMKSSSCRPNLPEIHLLQLEENTFIEQSGVLEKLISKLCFTEDLKNDDDEDYTIEMKTIYEILNSKSGLKYSLLKDIILDQLLIAISTSKQDKVVRTSLSILSTIVTENRSVIDDIKRKGIQLYDLATALKRNVHEAVILIYLINPSPDEIKTLELLPCLVEVVCASKSYYKVELLITPPSASLMIIEVLVTAFDYETNSMHLAAISSPRVLSGLLKVPRKDNIDEFVSLAAILVECMRFDGKCRKYISEFCPVSPFVTLLWSNEKRATCVALEFFNDMLRMPRSSATGFLEQMQKQGSMNSMCALFFLTQNSEPEYRLLAANLLLQLEVLENTSEKCVYREEAAEALLESLTREDCPATQALSAFILSNLGGTYSWTGEPYTVAWLVKKTGLNLAHHRNLIKNYDFLDQSLKDAGIDSWCNKTVQRMLRLGTPIFYALNKGLKNKLKRVSRDCLIATAWIGCELVKGPDELRHAACEILLQTIEQYMHPGLELEERLLACLCIYNYTSGKGMKKIIHLSEGVRESLRRLSSVTWMAEELLKVADYFQPNKWRISCVHSQILEAGNKNGGAVTALIYYKGHLYSGYADGSIKVWDIKEQTATLVQEMKEHKKAVTCFSLYEPGNCLLSGSADKTIKMWQMLDRNLECIEVIPTKESIRSIDSWGELIFATTQSHKLKIIDASRKAKDIFKNKRVRCIRVSHGKVYAGCMDSSIQELMIINNRQQEIKAPSKNWMQNKPISSVAVYKDWLYCASLVVEGSKMKDWRRSNKPQISIVPEKGANILAMEVVEDFIYLNCSTSMSSLQIWLRGTQQKVGRLSAGSKITSLLSANDIILCGTEKGLIKGWIPI